ncbi:VOC family protein [Chloroflexi bacterium TSY]|nr:VOC family protein [Chloroflexi bacterium TSY]
MLGKPTRPGFHTVTPYLIARELEPMIEFLKAAFGAIETFRASGSGGGTHVELRIGDSMVMVGGSGDESVLDPMPTKLFLYLENVDSIYHAALAAGATSLAEPGPMFGEPRGAGIKDPSGNDWYFARWEVRPDAPPAYGETETGENRDMSDTIPMLAYEDGLAAMDWLTKAFGFDEKERWLNDDGTLAHGEMTTGSGHIMLATPTPDYQSPRQVRERYEPARIWSETPWIINGVMVYVDDVDAHFAQAKEAGATILSELEDGFPGRRYRAEDLEGQRWMFMQRDSH